MTIGSKLPPDLNPIASEEFRRARKADYERKLRKRELERMAGSGRSGAESSRGLVRALAWTVGLGVAGFLGVAIPNRVLNVDALLGWVVLLVTGIVVGMVAVNRAGRWSMLGFVAGAASVAPVFLLLGGLPFLGDGWFVVTGLHGLLAFIGYTIGGWLQAARTGPFGRVTK